MELELVSFNQAKSLKELGFPNILSYQACPYSYFDKYLIDINNNDVSTLNPKWREVKNKDICFAPSLELAAKWLRKEKKLSISVSWMPNIKKYNCICSDMNYTPKEHPSKDAYKIYKEQFEVHKNDNDLFDDYKEALSAGINKAIEMLTNKEE